MENYNTARILQRLATLLAIVALSFVGLAGITGILLAFYYDPSASGAFESLRAITETIPGGNLIRSLHHIAGNGLIVLALLQIIVMFLGRQLRTSWFVAWLSGGFLALVAIGLGWTAMILDWDQLGYWRLKIEVGIFGGLPVIGDTLRALILGGDSISTATVERMYTLHSYLLSMVSVVLAIVHLVALVYAERRPKSQTASESMQAPAQASETEAARDPVGASR